MSWLRAIFRSRRKDATQLERCTAQPLRPGEQQTPLDENWDIQEFDLKVALEQMADCRNSSRGSSHRRETNNTVWPLSDVPRDGIPGVSRPGKGAALPASSHSSYPSRLAISPITSL
jgi:hypothetical protein